MNSSSLRALATERIIGRSRNRPASASTTIPMTRGARANRTPKFTPCEPLPITLSATSRGATARSWNSNTEKTARPAGDCSRFFSASAGMATAVEDRASDRPRITATSTRRCRKVIPPPARRAEPTATCKPPSPNTNRRIARSRSHDSSRPMVKSRNTTPNSASCATSAGLATVKAPTQGMRSASAPNP